MSAFSPRQMFLLDLACQPIAEALGTPYLVGTAGTAYVSTERQEYRDVDVRLILADDRYDLLAEALGSGGVAFLGLAIGQYLASLTDMPIDFQVQRQTQANAMHQGSRNPLGVRTMAHFRGDAAGEQAALAVDPAHSKSGGDSLAVPLKQSVGRGLDCREPGSRWHLYCKTPDCDCPCHTRAAGEQTEGDDR